MLHPAAYIEFRSWLQGLGFRTPSAPRLAWHWLRQAIGWRPGVAPVDVPGLRHPIFLRPWSSDLYVFEQIYVERQYETDVTPPATALDAGANIGLAAVYFANRFPEARIWAIEPAKENFAVLLLNTRKYPNIRCHCGGVWSRQATIAIENRDAKGWALRFVEVDPAAAPDDAVAAVAIDDLAEEHLGGQPFDLLKIDIEGAEKDVFAAGGRWLEAAETIIVESHDRVLDGCERAVLAAVDSTRFTLGRSGENLVFRRRHEGQGRPATVGDSGAADGSRADG